MEICLSFCFAVCVFFSDDGEIRCEQMNMVTTWIGEFQTVNGHPDEEVVFDVLCGDLNFDNCSPSTSACLMLFLLLFLLNVFILKASPLFNSFFILKVLIRVSFYLSR